MFCFQRGKRVILLLLAIVVVVVVIEFPLSGDGWIELSVAGRTIVGSSLQPETPSPEATRKRSAQNGF
jgi:hypothetical protein